MVYLDSSKVLVGPNRKANDKWREQKDLFAPSYFHIVTHTQRCSFEWSSRFLTGIIRFDCISDQLYFGCVLWRVTLGSGRLITVRLKIGYSSYRVSINSVSVEVRVEFQSVSDCRRLIIGSVLPGTDWVRVFSSRICLRIANY